MRRWWGIDRVERIEPGGPGDAGDLPNGPTVMPDLVDAGSQAVRADLVARREGFTPDWRPTAADPGVVVVGAFAEQLVAVRQRLNRLPEAQLRSLLDIGGAGGRRASPARATLVLTLAEDAPDAPRLTSGTRFTAPPAGPGDPVSFETTRDLVLTGVRLRVVLAQTGAGYRRHDAPALPTHVFGEPPAPGSSLWLGFDTAAAVGETLDLGFRLAAAPGTDAADLVRAGRGVRDHGLAVLAWDVITPEGPRAVRVTVDTTAALTRTGEIQLVLPEGWAPTRPPGGVGGDPRRWLRVRLVRPAAAATGGAAPTLAGIDVNAAAVEATETVRDEVLDAVADDDGGPRRRFRLRRVPVVPDSVRIEVDVETGTDVFGIDGPGAEATTWERRTSLSGTGPDDRVFSVDGAAGTVLFGDGIEGAAVPEGFRNVRAMAYRAGGGDEGNVGAGTTFTPVDTIPFLVDATNPVAAGGGAPPEDVARVLRTGPRSLRARGRAVLPADYEAHALSLPGAALSQARAFAAVDLDGAPRPGVVTIVAVSDRPGAPRPDGASLAGVARALTGVAPAAVRVELRPPRLVPIQVEATIDVDPDHEGVTVVAAAAGVLDALLDPVGTADEPGWPLGRAVHHREVVRKLATVPGVAAVVRLVLVRGGRRLGACTDAELPPDGLPEPGAHRLIVSEPGGIR